MDWLPTLTPRRLRQLWYAPALALAMGLTMLRLLVMAHLLDVPAFASYSAGLLVSSTFCMVSCLGLQSLLQREWPVLLMRGRRRQALIRAGQCGVLMVLTAAAVVPLAWIGVAEPVLTPLLVVAGIWHGVAQQAFLVASTGSRSEGDALGYSMQQLARSALAFAGAVAVAAWIGRPLFVLLIEAAVAAALSAGTLNGALKQARLGWRVLLRQAVRRLPRVPWRAALLSMAVMLAAFAMLNADRWMGARFLATADFAQYSFAAILLAMGQAMQALINASVYPLLARRFAAHGLAAVFSICFRASLGIALIGLLLSVPFIALAQHIIATWYPNYADASALVPLMTFIGVLRISDFFSSFLMITGHEARMLAVNLVALALALGLWLAWAGWSGTSLALQHLALLAAALSILASGIAAIVSWAVQRHPNGATC